MKDPATFAPMLEVARAHDAVDRLWVCHPDLDLLREWRDLAPDARLVNSTALDDMPFGPERRAAELAAARIDAVNLRQQYWTGGLTTLFHRFDVLCFGWDAQHERQIARLIDLGIDGLYSDYRRSDGRGRGDVRVRRAGDAAAVRELQEAEVAERPDLQERPPDDRVLVDRTEGPGVGAVAPIVAEHEVVPVGERAAVGGGCVGAQPSLRIAPTGGLVEPST